MIYKKTPNEKISSWINKCSEMKKISTLLLYYGKSYIQNYNCVCHIL